MTRPALLIARKEFWEVLEEIESQDPLYVPTADEEMEDGDASSDDHEMEEAAGGHEDDTTTDGGGGGVKPRMVEAKARRPGRIGPRSRWAS